MYKHTYTCPTSKALNAARMDVCDHAVYYIDVHFSTPLVTRLGNFTDHFSGLGKEIGRACVSTVLGISVWAT